MRALVLGAKTPYFTGRFRARLPEEPTYGGRGILWASLTLALMTLPVVIVATEEAISAVPGSMREGSLACGATRWQTALRGGPGASASHLGLCHRFDPNHPSSHQFAPTRAISPA